jgi:hypothetical protein
MTVGVADGSQASVWQATKPATAFVIGLPQPVFEITPTFVPGNNVMTLWGRADFFRAFVVGFNEIAQQITLTA